MSAAHDNISVNWLLVEWFSDKLQEVVCAKEVQGSNITKNLKPGVFNLVRDGETRKAIILASAETRTPLDFVLESKATVAGPSKPKSPAKEEEKELEEAFSASDSEWVPSDSDADSEDSQQHVETLRLARKTKKRRSTPRGTENVIPLIRANSILATETNQQNTPKETNHANKKNKVVKNCMNLEDFKQLGRNIDAVMEVFNPCLTQNNEIKAQVCSMLLDIKDLLVSDSKKLNNNVERKVSEEIESTDTIVEENASKNKKSHEKNKDTLETEMKSASKESTNHVDTSQGNVVISNTLAKIEETNVVTKENKNDDRTTEWIPIGSGTTVIHHTKYKKINFDSYSTATRGLLSAVFPRSVLATHSLSGRRAPAFPDKPVKMGLDHRAVSDIIEEVLIYFPDIEEKSVRNLITTKCADECKMMRMRNRRAAQDANRT